MIKILFLLMMGISLSIPAYASSSNTIGDVVYDAGNDLFSPLAIMLSGIAYMLSIWMAGNGLWYLKRAGDENDNGRHTIAQGMFRIFGAGALGALPDTLNVGIGTFFANMSNTNVVSLSSAGSVSSCMSDSGSTNALTCVAENVGRNIVPVSIQVIFIGMFLVGACIIMKEVYGLATHQEGGRKTLGSMSMKILVGIICCNVSAFFYAFENTFGISNSIITNSGAGVSTSSVPSMLSYTPSSSVAVLESFSTLISWCFVFLVLVGVLSFVRGVAILYSHSEGQSRSSLTSAYVHMIAGILLANGKYTMCFMLSSFIGDGLGFCS